jgi:hypothetical protein
MVPAVWLIVPAESSVTVCVPAAVPAMRLALSTMPFAEPPVVVSVRSPVPLLTSADTVRVGSSVKEKPTAPVLVKPASVLTSLMSVRDAPPVE